MIEINHGNLEFEHKYHEIEQKFLPLFPEQFTELRKAALPIEQYYLSHPSEPFSLRFRETIADDGAFTYTAALKDRGTQTHAGLNRREIETPITPTLYEYYKSPDAPLLRKLRASISQHITIDFYDDGYIQVESEHPTAWASYTEQCGAEFLEVTGDKSADNEWRAHVEYRRNNAGREAFVPEQDLATAHIVHGVTRRLIESPHVILQICGRSGSGKSTVVNQLQEELRLHGITSLTLSTDNYHRGSSWLRTQNNGHAWENWDHPIVYDIHTMMHDISRLQEGHSIPYRVIDFLTEEPAHSGIIKPADVLIVEGIYAGSPLFDQLNPLRYTLPTPLATSIGRRIVRDMNERPQFADAEKNLRYIL